MGRHYTPAGLRRATTKARQAVAQARIACVYWAGAKERWRRTIQGRFLHDYNNKGISTMSTIFKLSALASAALLLAACGPASETPPPAASTAPAAAPPAAAAAYSAAVNTARLVAADSEPGNWMSNGRDYGEQRFSPLDQLNTENVNQLSLAWYADIDTSRGQEAREACC